jgi:hypothetical protein
VSTLDPNVSERAAAIVATLTDEQLETAIGEGEARWKAGRWAIGDSIIMDALAAEWTTREERRVALEWEDA